MGRNHRHATVKIVPLGDASTRSDEANPPNCRVTKLGPLRGFSGRNYRHLLNTWQDLSGNSGYLGLLSAPEDMAGDIRKKLARNIYAGIHSHADPETDGAIAG